MWSRDGALLFSSPNTNAIYRLDPAAGHLFVCGPGGIWVLSPDGEKLGLIELPEAPHNLAWGDADGRALYITALSSVYRLRLQGDPR